jgi:hypothetical protein
MFNGKRSKKYMQKFGAETVLFKKSKDPGDCRWTELVQNRIL